MKRVALLAMFALGVLLAPALADGGGLHGYVRSGGVIAGATVVVSGPAGTISTRSNSLGFYAVLGLLPGTYQVLALKPGFHLNDCSDVPASIEPDEVRTWDVFLDPDTIQGLCYPGPTSLLDPDATADVYDVH
jgi:hypothetical protein